MRTGRVMLLVACVLVGAPLLTAFVWANLPCHDTATWEAYNGRYIGHWRIARGEEQRFPAFVARRGDLRIEEINGGHKGPGVVARDLVVSWNGVPHRARAEVGQGGLLAVSIVYADPDSAPDAPAGARSEGFSLDMLTLQFDGPLPFLDAIDIDDPDYDHLFLDFRAGEFGSTGLELDCVRYVRADY